MLECLHPRLFCFAICMPNNAMHWKVVFVPLLCFACAILQVSAMHFIFCSGVVLEFSCIILLVLQIDLFHLEDSEGFNLPVGRKDCIDGMTIGAMAVVG